MVDYNTALNTVKSFLGINGNETDRLVILEDATIDFEAGWVFFYQSVAFIKTGNILHALGGNAPIIVDKLDGSLHRTGTAFPIEKYITDYVKSLER